MSGIPLPPEATKVTCISKSKGIARFKGQEISPDVEPVELILLGDTEYFEVGKSYANLFQPLK